jgi:beta-N-acetylhexosaminidase
MPIVMASMDRLSATELVPFRGGIDAGAALVMTAHIALPAIDSSRVPATLSPMIITGLLRDSLHFHGLAITDAMTMEGIGKGYTTEESSVLAVKAGADVLLKPSDPTRAIDGVVAAVEHGVISRARIDSAARRVLELKARVGLPLSSQASLTALREIVGAPDHRATATRIARGAITLLRDRDSLVPSRATGKALVVQYAPETELRAGKAFGAAIRTGRATLGPTQLAKIGPNASHEMLDSLGRLADSASVVVIAAYVRRVEGEGRFAVPQPVAAWIDSLAMRRPVVVVAFGNPYLIRQFPSVQSYMVTYGVSDDLERAAVDALLGVRNISGKVPVSLPGFFTRGDGLSR